MAALPKVGRRHEIKRRSGWCADAQTHRFGNPAFKSATVM